MILTDRENSILTGATGTMGDRMAMEVVVETARLLGAEQLVDIQRTALG